MTNRRTDAWRDAALAFAAQTAETADPWLTPRQLAGLAQEGLGHRICWAIPQDATAEGWHVASDGAVLEEATDEDHDLGLEDAVTEAMASARALGGAWLWPVTGAPLREVLSTAAHPVSAIHVLTAQEVTGTEWDKKETSRNWSRPTRVNVQPIRDGGAPAVGDMHASHLVYVPGAPTLPDAQIPHLLGYDQSYLQLYAHAIRRWAESADAIGLTVVRRGMPQVKMSAASKAGNLRAEISERLKVLRTMMGAFGMLIVGETDDITWTVPPMGGTSEAMDTLSLGITAIEGAPISKWFGTAPSGLSTDDEAGQRSWDAILRRAQKRVTPALLRYYTIRWGVDTRRRVVWAPLGQPDGETAARTSLLRVQRDETLIRIGAITADEVRARYVEGDELEFPQLDAANDAPEGIEDLDVALAADPTVPGVAPGGAAVQDTALNGSQVASLLSINEGVTARTIAPKAAELLVIKAFPAFSPAEAAQMINASAAFEAPASEPTQPVPPELTREQPPTE